MLLTLFAEMTFAEKMRDAITVTIVGMGTVFVSLFIMGELFAALHRYFHGRVEPDALKSEPPNRVGEHEGLAIEEHLIPILVAAATAYVGRRVAVRRITFINRNTVSGWAEAGRASIQLSHNIRRTM